MRVLLAVDRSRDVKAAVDFLRSVRLPVPSSLHLLHVLELPRVPGLYPNQSEGRRRIAALRQYARRRAHELLQTVARSLERPGLSLSHLVKEGLPTSEILNALDRHRVDLAVLGTQGVSGLRRLLMGSVSELVLNYATSSVLMLRAPSRPRRRRRGGIRVVLATDGSAVAREAGRFLERLGLPPSSRVTVIHVAERPSAMLATLLGPARLRTLVQDLPGTRQRERDVLQPVVTRLKGRGFTVERLLVEGHPAEKILDVAKTRQADLVVLGARGTTTLRRVLFGSVSRKVARHAPCSVLVVRKKGR